MKDRTVERGRGCWNCIHFENGDLFQKRFKEVLDGEEKALRIRDAEDNERIGIRPDGTAIALTRTGDYEEWARKHAPGQADAVQPNQPVALFQLMKFAASKGLLGLCMVGKGGTPSDFKHYKVLCASWSGKTGHSLATAGRPLDKLPDELRDIIDSRAKVVAKG